MWRYLHLANKGNALPRGDAGFEKIYRVRKFLDLVLRNCQDLYIPYRDLSAKFHRKEE